MYDFLIKFFSICLSDRYYKGFQEAVRAHATIDAGEDQRLGPKPEMRQQRGPTASILLLLLVGDLSSPHLNAEKSPLLMQ